MQKPLRSIAGVEPETVRFRCGKSLLITTDVLTATQITRASLGAPYYSLVVEVDVAIIRDLVLKMGTLPPST